MQFGIWVRMCIIQPFTCNYPMHVIHIYIVYECVVVDEWENGMLPVFIQILDVVPENAVKSITSNGTSRLKFN